jgi:predicted O-linked N-acetylglucosamine transferase (SPINDLY family)
MNDKLLQSAWRLHQAGNLIEASRLYNEVLRGDPRNFHALLMLGFLHFQRGEYGTAEKTLEAALRVNPNSVDAHYNRGSTLMALGRNGEALASFDNALRLKPDFVPALLNRGNTLSQLGRYQDAILSYDMAISLVPAAPEAHLNRGNALFELKRFEKALMCYERAASLEPRDPMAWCNRGNALSELGRHSQALECYRKALALVPGYTAALEGRGNVFLALGRDGEALADFTRALADEPDTVSLLHARARALSKLNRHAEALQAFDKALTGGDASADILTDKGVTLIALRRYTEALEIFDSVLRRAPRNDAARVNRASALIALNRHAEALDDTIDVIAADAENAEAWHNRASALAGLKRLHEALAAYDKALALCPQSAASWTNRGNTLAALHRREEALVDFGRALSITASDVEALLARANALFYLKRLPEALADCETALSLVPDHSDALSLSLRCRLHACDWRDDGRTKERILTGLMAGRRTISPLDAKALFDSEDAALRAARVLTAETCPPSAPLWRGEIYRHDKIRVAYLSTDFRTHAVASLIAGVFENHDSDRFETAAVSFGVNDGSEMRERIAASAGKFIDAQDMSDDAVAALLHEMKIDIAVDLNGHTGDARTRVLASRPAPVQVNYLGFPGSMGAPYIDYILADRIVIPPSNAAYYDEKIVYLPHSYQINDSKRPSPSLRPPRAQAGLPERGFIFCSFNNSYKILPDVFGIWMHLLRETEGSILWLLADNPIAADNLRRETMSRGIDPERIVFAPRVSPDEHLARLPLADLFLDTLPYNAHTTASDALWMGLPLVTCLGHTFSGRVAASLLTTAGLPELIANSMSEYEELARRLARAPGLLEAFRGKLTRNRDASPLFNTKKTTRVLENAYTKMREHQRKGQPPESFAVTP